MAQWIKTSVRFDKRMENGTKKRVTDSYLVDALSFAEAEAKIIKEVAIPLLFSGEFTVSAVKKSNIQEIFRNKIKYDDVQKWYKAKVAFITLDEKTNSEKRTIAVYMVQAPDFHNALENYIEGMKKETMEDFVIVGIEETTILDVFDEELHGA